MDVLDTLLEMIRERRVCDADTFGSFRLQIDERYESTFETEWMRCFEQLESVKLTRDELRKVNLIRETAYKAAYSITENSEVAGLVSDDFELIGKGAISHIDSPWLNGLWLSYRSGKFPSGKIDKVDGTISLLIN